MVKAETGIHGVTVIIDQRFEQVATGMVLFTYPAKPGVIGVQQVVGPLVDGGVSTRDSICISTTIDKVEEEVADADG
ncbi:hypothetical protein HT576_09085 [Haloterrigena sp. SYSU A121-1]|uniref:Uncharacterized protein n=2 Tax=Haloterrigena gelatinilytica TaxID=2741724 RepID=A0A8J8GKZ5_9EURY|nr:hypothetical protein [Haloterrigena gelatinilytica]